MSVTITFSCDGRNCNESCRFTVLALAEDVIQARDRLQKEGWTIRPHQRASILRALCPACAALARNGGPGVHKGLPAGDG